MPQLAEGTGPDPVGKVTATQYPVELAEGSARPLVTRPPLFRFLGDKKNRRTWGGCANCGHLPMEYRSLALTDERRTPFPLQSPLEVGERRSLVPLALRLTLPLRHELRP